MVDCKKINARQTFGIIIHFLFRFVKEFLSHLAGKRGFDNCEMLFESAWVLSLRFYFVAPRIFFLFFSRFLYYKTFSRLFARILNGFLTSFMFDMYTALCKVKWKKSLKFIFYDTLQILEKWKMEKSKKIICECRIGKCWSWKWGRIEDFHC